MDDATVIAEDPTTGDGGLDATVETTETHLEGGEQDQGSEAENVVFYTDEELLGMVERGENFDEKKLSPVQTALYKPFKGDYTKKTMALAEKEKVFAQRQQQLQQAGQYIQQVMQKAMETAPVDERVYMEYVQNPQATIQKLRNAAQQAEYALADDTLDASQKRQAIENRAILNETIANVQARFQREQQTKGYAEQLMQAGEAEVLKAIPDIAAKAPKLDTFVKEYGMDVSLAAALTDPLFLDVLCKQKGINLTGAQARAQVYKFINNTFDKTAGVVQKTTTAAPSKTLTSKTTTPVKASGTDSSDPFDPSLSADDRIALFRKMRRN